MMISTRRLVDLGGEWPPPLMPKSCLNRRRDIGVDSTLPPDRCVPWRKRTQRGRGARDFTSPSAKLRGLETLGPEEAVQLGPRDPHVARHLRHPNLEPAAELLPAGRVH